MCKENIFKQGLERKTESAIREIRFRWWKTYSEEYASTYPPQQLGSMRETYRRGPPLIHVSEFESKPQPLTGRARVVHDQLEGRGRRLRLLPAPARRVEDWARRRRGLPAALATIGGARPPVGLRRPRRSHPAKMQPRVELGGAGRQPRRTAVSAEDGHDTPTIWRQG